MRPRRHREGRYWMPGDHPNGATKFARHCGHIEAALCALAVPFIAVAPLVWMKKLGMLPKKKTDRKKANREEMQRRVPHLSVTLKTADALGLLEYEDEDQTPFRSLFVSPLHAFRPVHAEAEKGF